MNRVRVVDYINRISITSPTYINQSFRGREFTVDVFLSGDAVSVIDPLTGRELIFRRKEYTLI